MNKYDLPEPFFGLAPMANITTYPFASQVVEFGADLVWTPMVHSEALIHNPSDTLKIVDFKEIKNYVVQIIGSDVSSITKAISIVTENLDPKGIDLNFACPDKNILKSGCGGFLMQNPQLIIDILKAARETTKLPLSVKTRAGWTDPNEIFSIAEQIAELVDMLTVHPRVVKQGFTGSANWEVLGELKKNFPSIFVVGSGDIKSWEEALQGQTSTGVNGVLIGRGALGKPWIFREIKDQKSHAVDPNEVRTLVLDLAQKADSIWGEKGITESKKHFAWYFKGFEGASEIRANLMGAKNLTDVQRILT